MLLRVGRVRGNQTRGFFLTYGRQRTTGISQLSELRNCRPVLRHLGCLQGSSPSCDVRLPEPHSVVGY